MPKKRSVRLDREELSSVLGEMYSRSEELRGQLTDIIESVAKHITDLESAVILTPLIKDLLNTSVKNDDQLAKVAQILHKALGDSVSDDSSDTTFMGLDLESAQELLDRYPEIDITSSEDMIRELIEAAEDSGE